MQLPLLDHSLVKKVRRPLGRVRRWLRARPARTQSQRDQLSREPDLTAADRKLLEQVETRISPNDGMYRGDGDHYFRVGLSAIRCVEAALMAAGVNKITEALDLPCGHGRVLRFLVQRFPETRWVACDLERDGVDFCAATFGAEPIYSQPNLGELTLGRQFNLIWCGSLVTHLDEQKIAALLECFARHLASGGLVIFTAAGARVVDWMKSGQFDYGIDRNQIPIITQNYQASGYGYTDYPYMPEYGISLTSPDWIRGQVAKVGGLKEVYFQPHGWDDHQDVYGFVRE